jgi:hypothetical protein
MYRQEQPYETDVRQSQRSKGLWCVNTVKYAKRLLKTVVKPIAGMKTENVLIKVLTSDGFCHISVLKTKRRECARHFKNTWGM